MSQHIVTSFEDDLTGLARSIAEMGGHAEQLVERSITALLRSDVDLAHQVIAADKRVDELQRLIEDRAVLVIARRQPLAQDLRETIAALRFPATWNASPTSARTSRSALWLSSTRPSRSRCASASSIWRTRAAPGQEGARCLCDA
jgi:phosphate uptake regulator